MRINKGKDKLYAETEMAGKGISTDMMTEIGIMIEG